MSDESEEAEFEGPWWRHPPLRNALLSGLIAGTGFVLARLQLLPEGFENYFYWIAIPLGAWHWTREGIEELIEEKEIGIEILMLAATAGSGILGLWDEAAALVFLYGAAEGVEEYTFARTRASIRALLDLAPKEARLLRDGKEIMVPAESVKPGDVFVMRPGESLPTDGIIRQGQSSLDESPITGESIPMDKGPGMKVYAASINRQGALEVEATATFADNTLSKIIHLVEEAQEQKGKAQQWIERFGRRYSPAVLVAAALLLLAPALFDVSFSEWSLRAVVLLVAAAPCALVMSTPVAMAAGIGSAGRRGILIKGGVHLEQLARVRVIAFDKTGTLTHGEPAVTDVVALGVVPEELLATAAALERYSEHPLARAIVEHVEGADIRTPAVRDFEALTGAGASAKIGETVWYIGNPDLFQHLGVNLSEANARISRLQEDGKTVVVVGNRTRVIGLIALQDRLRPGVRSVIEELHTLGLRTVMLTGDNSRTARAVARSLGIDDVRADLKPADKVAAVRSLEQQYGPVLMVGDGVNDAPALTAATVGVAMGVAGTDAAIEAADVALMADDLGKVAEALRLGRKARSVSVQNIVFSLLILAVLIPLAVTGLLGVAIAVLAHEVSELLAVANGLRASTAR